MTRYTLAFVTLVAVAAPGSARAQVPKNVPRVHHTQVRLITTPNRLVTAVVVGQNANPGLGEFVFCMVHEKPLAQPLDWTGPATVVYEAMGQIPGFEPAPEQLGIGSGVAVLPDDAAGSAVRTSGHESPASPGGSIEGRKGGAARVAHSNGTDQAGTVVVLRQRAGRRVDG